MRSNWRMFASYARPYRRRLALAVAGTVAFNALALSPPLIFRHLVDRVVRPGRWDAFAPVILIYALTPLLANLLQWVNTQNIVYIGQRVVADVRNGMYRLLLRLSMRYHGETPAGGLIARLMGDAGMVQQLVTGPTIQVVGDLMVFLFSVFVAFAINRTLAAILLVVIGLYAGAYRFFALRIQKATHSAREVNDLLVGRLQETLGGVRHVRIYTRELHEREVYLARTSEGLHHALTSGLLNVGLGTTCNVIAGYGSTVIYGLAAWYVLHGAMTLGDLLALNSYVWMALHPALRLTSFAGQFAQIRVSLQRIAEVLTQTPDIRSAPGAPALVCSSGRVEFRGVRFRYKPDEPLFEGLDLVAEPGATIALVGPSGCGKTTLTSLLMRAWDVQDGQVLIDGTDIRAVSLRSLRRLFGVVLQNPVVFEGTLAENIRYGRPPASREEIEAAAQAAEIDEFAERLPDGLDTVLGTYGVKLSVGQKQRVSIARALLKDPRILIMDEATSALDSEAEAAVQRAIGRVLRGRTSFVIAHRLSTIVGAGRIVVLERGRIVEQGPHETLMRSEQGMYRRLYEELCRAGREAPP